MSVEKLYPELAEHGGLSNTLNEVFKSLGSALRVSVNGDEPFNSSVYATIENDNKFSQVYIASETKKYLPDYWRDGVCLAHGNTDDIELLAASINFWLCSQSDTLSICKEFHFITRNKWATAFDEGKEIDYKWQVISNDPERKELKEFTELAMNDSVLRTLFPYTSLMRLCFSRCTGYPYTYDTPIVIPLPDNGYEVRSTDNTLIGTGSAMEAIKFVKDNLPKFIKPAIRGTAEDLESD